MGAFNNWQTSRVERKQVRMDAITPPPNPTPHPPKPRTKATSLPFSLAQMYPIKDGRVACGATKRLQCRCQEGHLHRPSCVPLWSYHGDAGERIAPMLQPEQVRAGGMANAWLSLQHASGGSELGRAGRCCDGCPVERQSKQKGGGESGWGSGGKGEGEAGTGRFVSDGAAL